MSSGRAVRQPAIVPKTGVYGYAAQDATAAGVRGESTTGRGVDGFATSGMALHGTATTGYGARAYAATGTAGYFSTGGLKKGTALQAVGRVRFDKSVGIATIAAATRSVTVTPGIDLTATRPWWRRSRPPGGHPCREGRGRQRTADTFTIYLTANTTAAVKVAWHVFG